MLYSHSQEIETINLFTSFLDRAAEGDKKYAPVVNEVLLETHKYASGRKTLYDINRDLLHLILYLSTLNNLYFKSLVSDPKKYNKRIYSEVLGLISEKEEHPLAKSA